MSTSRSARLQAATDHLYGVFARYPFPDEMQARSEYLSDDVLAALRGAPLRELPSQALSRYACKGMTTWGNVDDFRYFLPRILDLISHDGGADWIDPEVPYGKLTDGGWMNWPAAERKAIDSFLEAQWADVLGRFPHPFEVDSCLCCIGRVVDDLSPFLNAWDVAALLPAAQHFADFIESNTIQNQGKRKPWALRNAFWSERDAQAAQVEAWLLSPERGDALERAFYAFGDTDDEVAATSLAAFATWCQIREAPRGS